MARTRSCKKTGRLKKPTKSGRKCRKVSKCVKGKLKSRQGRRQCKKKSTRRRPKTRGRPKTRRKHKRKYSMHKPTWNSKNSYPGCEDMFHQLNKTNMYASAVTDPKLRSMFEKDLRKLHNMFEKGECDNQLIIDEVHGKVLDAVTLQYPQ